MKDCDFHLNQFHYHLCIHSQMQLCVLRKCCDEQKRSNLELKKSILREEHLTVLDKTLHTQVLKCFGTCCVRDMLSSAASGSGASVWAVVPGGTLLQVHAQSLGLYTA